jgi:hypothetical protein
MHGPWTRQHLKDLQIIGRNNVRGTSVAATSNVMPTSLITSANNLHFFTLDLNLFDAKAVNNKVLAIPKPSRTRKLIEAERAVAPSLPTPTPSNTLCVAKMALICVDRSCIHDQIQKLRKPGGVLSGNPTGKNVLLIKDSTFLKSRISLTRLDFQCLLDG